MSPVWDADNEIDAGMAARLIDAQFPRLAPAQVEALGVGWDNVAFLVNGVHVFRFPRRQLGAALLRHETRILPQLAPLVPLPIPVPEHLGRPEGAYPYAFTGYPIIPGVTACQREWTDEQRADTAEIVGAFLRSLHAIPVDSGVREWAPADDLRRADVAWRAPRVRERLTAIAGLAPPTELQAAHALVDRLATTPLLTGASCWVHGDLYGRHLLIDADARPCGVIDWGDVHLGDPALDLSIVYSFLPAEARPRFWSVYGATDADTSARAQFRAISYAALLIDYGADVADAAILRLGRDALRLAIQ